jgi:hypothetical protein
MVCHFNPHLNSDDVQFIRETIWALEKLLKLKAEGEQNETKTHDDESDNDECGASSKDLYVSLYNVKAIYEKGQLFEINVPDMVNTIHRINAMYQFDYSILSELKLQQAISNHSL